MSEKAYKLKFKISQDQLDRARELYEFSNLKDSIMEGRSNIYGALGEILVYDQYISIAEYAGFYDYDLLIKDRKIDVKSKKTTVIPQPHFHASVANANISQDCDYYCFVRIHESFYTGWLLGWKNKDEFFEKADFHKGGESDPQSSFGWQFRDDCWNLPIRELD